MHAEASLAAASASAWTGHNLSVWRADNARFYGASGVPFVMGTTGGDREALMRDVEAAGVSAVIAPQMGKQARPAPCTAVGVLAPGQQSALYATYVPG